MSKTVYNTCRVVVIMAELESDDSCNTEAAEQLPPSKREELEESSSLCTSTSSGLKQLRKFSPNWMKGRR